MNGGTPITGTIDDQNPPPPATDVVAGWAGDGRVGLKMGVVKR